MLFLVFLPTLISCLSAQSESTTISGRLTTTTKKTYFSSVAFNQTSSYSVSITDSAVTHLICDISMSSGEASLHVSTTIAGKAAEWWSRQEGNDVLEFKASDKAFKADKHGLMRSFNVDVIGAKRDSLSAFRLTITLESNAEYAEHDKAAVALSVLSANSFSVVEVAEGSGGAEWWGLGALVLVVGTWAVWRDRKTGNGYYPLR